MHVMLLLLGCIVLGVKLKYFSMLLNFLIGVNFCGMLSSVKKSQVEESSRSQPSNTNAENPGVICGSSGECPRLTLSNEPVQTMCGLEQKLCFVSALDFNKSATACTADTTCPILSINGVSMQSKCELLLSECRVPLPCWPDESLMHRSNAYLCCSREVNDYKPRNQSRCGKIPNDYYCADDTECQSSNCGKYAGHWRHESTRTCAPSAKLGWQADCTGNGGSCVAGLQCGYGSICDCSIQNDPSQKNYTCCSTGLKETKEDGCIAAALGSECANDIECGHGKQKVAQDRSCDGKHCVAFKLKPYGMPCESSVECPTISLLNQAVKSTCDLGQKLCVYPETVVNKGATTCITDDTCRHVIVNNHVKNTKCDHGLKLCVIVLDCFIDDSKVFNNLPNTCCSGVINKFKPRNQMRCGLIPNNYYCTKNDECQSKNCGAYNGHWRHLSTRTCAPEGEGSWQTTCDLAATVDHCTSGLKCKYGSICDCDVNGNAVKESKRICCSDGKIPQGEAQCQPAAINASCTNDIHCAGVEQTVQKKSCDGTKCVTVTA